MLPDIFALLDEADTKATYLAATGLVGQGAAVAYLTWRREADLPDPALVVADPTSVTWRTLAAVHDSCRPCASCSNTC
jgi:hypothetical protein